MEQFFGLVLQGLCNIGMVVAQGVYSYTSGKIQILSSFIIVKIDPFTLFQHDRQPVINSHMVIFLQLFNIFAFQIYHPAFLTLHINHMS